MTNQLLLLPVLALFSLALPYASRHPDDRATVAKLDTLYQAAVKANDAATMDKILADDFVLVLGNGSVSTKAQLLAQALDRAVVYEHQEDTLQRVRMYGTTAVVTARLWIKGRNAKGEAIDFKVWFSDTYVRTATGWRYAFGQAGCHL